MRTRVYVDGFCLFHAALSKSPYKWLDLYSLFEDHVLSAPVHVEHVHYYTARIKVSACDDPRAGARQQLYLRALASYRRNEVTVREGFMQRNWKWLRLRRPRYGVDEDTAEVGLFCEKRTDVNLAADLISDAWRGWYEQAVICSNDSDLQGAVEAVRRDKPGLTIGLVVPGGDAVHVNRDLAKVVHWYKKLSLAHLAAAQLPTRIPCSDIVRPSEWD